MADGAPILAAWADNADRITLTVVADVNDDFERALACNLDPSLRHLHPLGGGHGQTFAGRAADKGPFDRRASGPETEPDCSITGKIKRLPVGMRTRYRGPRSSLRKLKVTCIAVSLFGLIRTFAYEIIMETVI